MDHRPAGGGRVPAFAASLLLAFVAAIGTLATLAAWPLAVKAAEPASAFFWESEADFSLGRGTAGVTTPSATFNSYSYTTGLSIWDPDGTSDWIITVGGPAGGHLAPGVYDDVAWGNHASRPWVWVGWDSGSDCREHSAQLTVHDIGYTGDQLSLASMSIFVACQDADEQGRFHGELRFNTAAPAFKALSQSPFGWNYPLGEVAVGDVGAKRWVTVTNEGAGPLTFGTASIIGPDPGQFEITDDTCSRAALGEGSSCTYAVRTKPTRPGAHEATADFPVDTGLGRRQFALRSDGIAATTTTLDVPSGWAWGQVELSATVRPNPVRSDGEPEVSFEFLDDPYLIAFPKLDDNGVATTWQTLSPGDHRVYAEFRKYGHYAASRSETKTIHVGETTSIALSSDRNPAVGATRPRLTARLHATATPFAGGQLIIEDVTAGATLGTLAVTAANHELQVEPELTVGTHLIKATYSGHERHSSSAAELTQEVLLDATATIEPSTFYPVVDRYKDRLEVTGQRGVVTAVTVRIKALATDEDVFEAGEPAGTGSYRIAWPGTLPGSDDLAPVGSYEVTVTLDDGVGQPKVVRATITLSHDWVTWKQRSVVKDGRRFSLWGWTRNAKISTSRSRYPQGVMLVSNKGFAAIVYAFPVKPSKVHGWMSFEVLGKSPNRHKAMLAMWNPGLGGYKNLASYDAAKTAGPRFRWWKTGGPTTSHKKKGKARAAVMVWKGLGRAGKAVFDVKRVRLTYMVGTLHVAEPASVGASELERELAAAAPAGMSGQRVTQTTATGPLPKLRTAPASAESTLPANGPVSTLYYQSEPDAPAGRGRTFYTTSAESDFDGATVRGAGQSIYFTIGPDNDSLVPGTTYDTGDVRIYDGQIVIGTCSSKVAAFTVHDVAYDAGGSITLLSATMRWTCLDHVTGEPTGSFYAELRNNTTEPSYGGIVHEPLPGLRDLTHGASGWVTLGSAAIGSHRDTSLLVTAIGTRPTAIGSVGVSGPHASDFAIANDGCSGKTLAVGDTCTLDLRLQPTARGRHTALATIPLDTAFGRRQFWMGGDGKHATTTTIEVPKGPHLQRVEIRTRVQPRPDDGFGYTCMYLHLRGPDDRESRAGCDADGYATFRVSLPPGTWTVWAEAGETPGFAGSTSPSGELSFVEELKDWGTAWIGPATFYPHPDGYRDTLTAGGGRTASLAADISVTSVASGELVAARSFPAATGRYRWEWDGTSDEGAALPGGTYRVAVVLTDGAWNEHEFVKDVVLSRKWVKWTRKSVMLAGKQFVLFGKSRNAFISRQRSRYANGVRLGSGKGAAVVEYAFPVAKSKIYGWMTLEVQGRSPNRHKAVIALWNPKLGSYRNVASFDAARLVGPGRRWWRTGADGAKRVRKGKVRAIVLVAKGLGRPGPAGFDIQRVRLTYRVGTLRAPSAAAGEGTGPLPGPSTRDGPAGRRASDWGAAGGLPRLLDAARSIGLPDAETEDGAEVPVERPDLVADPPTARPRSKAKPKPKPPSTARPRATPTPEPEPEPRAKPGPRARPKPATAAQPKEMAAPTAKPRSEADVAEAPARTPPNEAPVADAGGPYKVNEGDTIRLDGTASHDPDGTLVTFEWTRTGRLDDPSRKRPRFSASDDGVVQIRLTVVDGEGASDTATAKIKIRNVDPSVAPIEDRVVAVGEVLVIPVAVRDPGSDDVRLSIDWGDGSVGSSPEHRYERVGTYTVTVTATDDDGGRGAASLLVLVVATPAGT